MGAILRWVLNMSLEKLEKILPIEGTPVEVPTEEQWSEWEAENFKLPEDYKEFILKYGSGSINDALIILNPFSNHPGWNLLNAHNEVSFAYNYLKEGYIRDGQEDLIKSLRLYPETEGLLAIATSNEGDYALWQTKGDADTWGIVVDDGTYVERMLFNENFTEFLVNYLTGENKYTGKLLSEVSSNNYFLPLIGNW